jgi:RHS repeat-associated protein
VESAVYKPFGEQSEWLLPGNAAPETKGWIGERFDADAGLQYLNARYYDPALGMFLQPDWWEVTKAGVGTNRYSYSFNDPVNLSDANGNIVPAIVGFIAVVSYFSSTGPANAPGPGDRILPPNEYGLAVGAMGGGLAVSGGKLAMGACVASPNCSKMVAAYTASETIMDVTGCAGGDAASCGAAAIPGLPGVAGDAAEKGLLRVDPNDLRFSQTTAGGNGRAEAIRKSMQDNGWIGPPVDVVRTENGRLVTIDNTRVAVAQELGITDIPATIHSLDDVLPEGMIGRFGDAETWGDALKHRTERQTPRLESDGTKEKPMIK